MGFLDAERIHDGDDVAARDVLAIACAGSLGMSDGG